jgi:hypothetical protein
MLDSYAHAYEYSFMRTSTHLASTICTCVRVRIHAYEYASSPFKILEVSGLQARSLQIVAHKFSYDLCKQSLHLPLSSTQLHT